MSTKFFNNTPDNSLFEKFKGIAHNMLDFHTFQAVVGYFRSSGYFKLREEFEQVKKIQILVGINIDTYSVSNPNSFSDRLMNKPSSMPILTISLKK